MKRNFYLKTSSSLPVPKEFLRKRLLLHWVIHKNTEFVAEEIRLELFKLPRYNIFKDEMLNLQTKFDIVILLAGKGNATVVLDSTIILIYFIYHKIRESKESSKYPKNFNRETDYPIPPGIQSSSFVQLTHPKIYA